MTRRSESIFVWAHRGFSAAYPENTRLAIEKALEYRIDGIECDLQKTKDGRFVILHDTDLSRLTGYRVRVSGLTLAEVKSLDFGQGQQILTLEELLAFYPPGKALNLELKADTITEADGRLLVQILDKRKHDTDFLISSFNWSLLFAFKRHGYKIGLLFGRETLLKAKIEIFTHLILLRPQAINVPVQAFATFHLLNVKFVLCLLRLLPLKFVFWTINSTADFMKVKYLADGIITDRPDLFTG